MKEKNRVETDIGTAVIDTPKYIRNPVTNRRENMDDLSPDGYCRRFLALLYASTRPDTVNLGSSPVATFDKDIWELEKTDDHYVLKKSNPDTPFDEIVMGGDEKKIPGTDEEYRD